MIAIRRRGAAAALLACAAVLPASCTSSSAPAAPAQHYVALGDSYAAGPLTGDQAGKPDGCLRAVKDYPHVVQATLKAATFTDVTCSGATTANLSAPQAVTDGVNPPQLDAVTSATTIVTLTIGGNDIGFGQIIEHCASLVPVGSPCEQYFTAGGADQVAAAVAATAPKVAAALAAVRERAPRARILLVGYPDLLPASGGCWPGVPFTDADANYLRGSEIAMDAMLAAQAAAAGAEYVDTYTRSVGHDMCSDPGVRWVEPLFPSSPAGPFHPNAEGERQMGEAVLATLRDATR